MPMVDTGLRVVYYMKEIIVMEKGRAMVNIHSKAATFMKVRTRIISSTALLSFISRKVDK